MTALRLVYVLIGLALAPTHAMAQEGGGRSGIAFVQAPELATATCTGQDPASSFACAEQKCIDAGGTAEDCVEMAYCFPALYSVSVSILHKEGIHWQEFHCGWDSREAALDAAKIACDTAKRPFIAECVASAIYDENGEMEDLINQ